MERRQHAKAKSQTELSSDRTPIPRPRPFQNVRAHQPLFSRFAPGLSVRVISTIDVGPVAGLVDSGISNGKESESSVSQSSGGNDSPQPGLSRYAGVREGATAKKESGGSVCPVEDQVGLRRLRLRRLKYVREQFFQAAAAQNIKDWCDS